MSIFRNPTSFDYTREQTPHEKVASQHGELLSTTTDTLGAFELSKNLMQLVLAVKAAYDVLFQPNLYNNRNNIHRLAATTVWDTLNKLSDEITHVKKYYRYSDTSYSFAQHMIAEAENIFNNIKMLVELADDLQLVDEKKKEYNLAEILSILKGNTTLTLSSNKLLDVCCYNDTGTSYEFDYELVFQDETKQYFKIMYTTPFPMHSLKLIETYIKDTGVQNLPSFKVKKI